MTGFHIIARLTFMASPNAIMKIYTCTLHKNVHLTFIPILTDVTLFTRTQEFQRQSHPLLDILLSDNFTLQ